MIYLDNAGTTKINHMVYAAMCPYLLDEYGNPGSVHELGIHARDAVNAARKQVAKAINAEPDEIIFTAGGTEANNFMVHAMSEYLKIGHPKVLSSLTEHDSMIGSLSRFDGEVELIPYEHTNTLLPTIANRAQNKYELMSFMYTNNELGFSNDVYEIGKLKKAYGFHFITDCVQALGHKEIDVKLMHCDMASFSSHKIHGPKGVGAVYVSREAKKFIEPLIVGGSNQEFGLRGGTENVAGIVGFGKACELINVDDDKTTISSLRKAFFYSLNAQISGKNIEYFVHFDEECSKIISITFKNVDAETLVLLLSSKGVYISAGSACKSLEQKPNQVLLAAGLSESEARSTVRISLSCYNTIDEMKEAGRIIADSVVMLSSLA